jgi:hypothetical protein
MIHDYWDYLLINNRQPEKLKQEKYIYIYKSQVNILIQAHSYTWTGQIQIIVLSLQVLEVNGRLHTCQ